jgi:hypothetical protein
MEMTHSTFITAHRIAGITFRTEANIWLPRLREGPYAAFLASEDAPPDVHHHIHQIDPELLTAGLLTDAEREQLLRIAFYVAPGALDSPIWGDPALRTWLNVNLERSQSVQISLYPELILAYDLSRRTIDFFYTEAYAHGSGDQDWREGATPGPSFRLHPILSDALPAVPLTAAQQEQMVHLTGLPLREVSEALILRSPIAQNLLAVSRMGSDEVTVFGYATEILIWNQTRDTFDLLYLDREKEEGGMGKRKVARNFPNLLVTFLPQFAGLMVHCAGVIRNDCAALFLAPDAGGKSTVLKRATDGFILSDDQVILRKEGTEFIAHATPLGMMTSGPGSARLGGMFILRKADHFALEPLSPLELIGAFWQDPGNLSRLLPKSLKLRAFDLFYDVCHQVPVYRMSFPKHYVDWDAIDSAMRHS